MSELRFSVSLHDVAPATWPSCARLLEWLEPYRVPVTLLVVPDYHRLGPIEPGTPFAKAVAARRDRGDEIVLHGYCHLDEAAPPRTPRSFLRRRLLTDGEGEFATLDEPEAANRIRAGLAILRAAGLDPVGFVPPAWLIGPGGMRALSASGLPYAATRAHLYRLPDLFSLPAPSLVYSTRSRARRLVSAAYNGALVRLRQHATLLRVALHPAEAQYPRVLAHWDRILRSLAAQRKPMLESAALRAPGLAAPGSTATAAR